MPVSTRTKRFRARLRRWNQVRVGWDNRLKRIQESHRADTKDITDTCRLVGIAMRSLNGITDMVVLHGRLRDRLRDDLSDLAAISSNEAGSSALQSDYQEISLWMDGAAHQLEEAYDVFCRIACPDGGTFHLVSSSKPEGRTGRTLRMYRFAFGDPPPRT